MSHGCGTLASPGSFRLSTEKAASGNGKQHTLPAKPFHAMLSMDDVEAHWDAKQSQSKPSRVWGTIKPNKLGGEERVDSTPDNWQSGEFWNVDSNIRRWGQHEVRRNASSAAHDVMRHDQIGRVVLQPQPGAKIKSPRLCTSGVVSADCSFLEAYGFDLGRRDRQARPAPVWHPVTRCEQFRAERSYSRNIPRMIENYRTLRRTASTPGVVHSKEVVTLRPEDIGGEAGEFSRPEDTTVERSGRVHGARSCRGWDAYNHAVQREGARTSLGVHAPALRSHRDAYPFKDNCELSPAAVYSRKYRKDTPE